MGILHSEEEIVYHFFTETEFFTESEAVITGPDVNHIKNVLRMKPGEKLLLSDGKGTNCLCEITELFPDKVLAKILPEEVDDTELPVKVTLYQGLPKADKMEFIIQKCVEGRGEEKTLVRDLRERGKTVEAHDCSGNWKCDEI